MTRKEEIINYANSFKGEGVENEELKETIRLAIIDGALWADEHPVHYDGKAYLYVLHKGVEQGKKEMLKKICEWLYENMEELPQRNNDGEVYDTCVCASKEDTLSDFISNLCKAMEDKK